MTGHSMVAFRLARYFPQESETAAKGASAICYYRGGEGCAQPLQIVDLDVNPRGADPSAPRQVERSLLRTPQSGLLAKSST